MDFRLLGPLEVLDDDGRKLSVGAGRQRALLGLLLLRPNEFVASDRLTDELWGESPPATAHRMLLNQVSALRRVLGRNGRLETRGSAYCLHVTSGERDVDRFEELLERARSLKERDPDRAAAALREALALWRGPPLFDLAYEPFARIEIARLEERRLVASEERVDVELALGRHADLVAELEDAIARHPLRERLHGQLMLALYRCGRQAEALQAYVRARTMLVEEIGAEPGPDLRALQAAILAQDPALDFLPRERELPPALAGGSPLLAGREGELAELKEHLVAAREGRGGLLLVSGRRGIGKTRLAAELAREAARAGFEVFYAGHGSMSPEDALAAVRRAATVERPALLVLDDVDEASPAVLAAAAELADAARSRSVLVLALNCESTLPPALSGLAARQLTLEPLGPEALAEIAALYTSSRGSAMPSQVLVAESAGVPVEAHRAASDWAREQAAERLVATAARVETERDETRATEAELSDEVIELEAARRRAHLYELDGEERDGASERVPAPVVCPFLGLATFDSAHAEYFFGRERLVAEMVTRLVGSSLLAVVGPSGSGKSSAVRAGLLPALAGGALPGSERWRQALLRPGERPLLELQAALERTISAGRDVTPDLLGLAAGLAPGERLVLTVDQFEEVFTACQDQNERAGFAEALVSAAADRDRRIAVVLAMRADFYGRCAAYERLAELVAANQVLVGPMRRAELRRAIELPARQVGLQVERGLVDALIADVHDEPGGLPLFSTALLELWRERDGLVLRRSAYVRTGGVRGAVARLAEATYERLREPERHAARRILLRLADAGDETAFVRRRVPRDELDLAQDEHAAAALAALIEQRLVSADERSVEVAHEALLREWPRLRAWLDEDAEGRRLHQHLIHAARDWDARGRDPGELYRGARLASTLDWAAQHDPELNQLEREFLAESRTEAQLEVERQRQTNRRLRYLLGGLGVLLALALAAGVVALDQRGSARHQEVAAQAQRLGAQALSANSLDLSLLLARQGVALDDSLATRSNLLAALLRSPAAVHVLRGVGGRMLAVAVDPGNRVVAAGDGDGHVLAFDTTGRRLRVSYDTGLPVRTLVFSPDGTRLAVASGHQGESLLDLLDARNFRPIAHHSLGGGPNPFHTIAFSPDSHALLSSYALWNPSGDGAKPALLARWDARTGRPLGRATPLAQGVSRAVLDQGEDSLVAFAARGRELVTLTEPENEIVLRDAATLRSIRRLRGRGLPWASAISPDGRIVALGRDDGSVRLLDLRTGKSRTASGRHDGSVQGAAFTPDGKTLVTVGDDAKVIVWDVASATPRTTFAGQGGRVGGVAVSPDGRTAYSASLDGTVAAWDLAGSRRLGRPFLTSPAKKAIAVSETAIETPTGASYNIGVTPNGDTIAVALANGYVNLIDSRTLRVRGRIHALRNRPTLSRMTRLRRVRVVRVTGANFAPNGRTLAVTAGAAGTLRFWDARTLAPLSPLLYVGLRAPNLSLDPDPVLGSRFTPDGRFALTKELDWVLRLWDVRRHVLVRRRQLTLNPQDLDIRPDGRVAAVPECAHDVDSCAPDEAPNGQRARGRDHVAILSLPSLQPVAQIPMKSARWARFSRDGRLLVVGNHDGVAQLYDGHSFRPVGRPLLGHTGFVITADFSPDGRTVATSSSDGTVRLWDTATSRPIGTPLPGLPDVNAGVAYILGGTRIVAVYDGGQGYVWDVRPWSWARRACAVAGRSLTRAEWQQYLPGRAYAPACASR